MCSSDLVRSVFLPVRMQSASDSYAFSLPSQNKAMLNLPFSPLVESPPVSIIAVKIANITGISTLVGSLVGHIASKIAEKKNAEMIAEKLADVLGDGTSGAKEAIKDLGDAAGSSSSKFGSLAKALGSLVGEAGLIVAVGAAAARRTIVSAVRRFSAASGTHAICTAACNGRCRRKCRISSSQSVCFRPAPQSLSTRCRTTPMSTRNSSAAVLR